MLYSVTKNNMMPAKRQDKYLPGEWPVEIDKISRAEDAPAGRWVATLQDIGALQDRLRDEYDRLRLLKFLNEADEKLLISDLVADEYRSFSPSKIDFTMHLRSDITLEKRDVGFLKNGRPTKATYYHGEVKVAEILFEFEADSLNFMTRRVRKLGYFTVSGRINQHYVIEDSKFRGDVPYQHKKRLEERTQARQWIIDSLRADVDKFLTPKPIPPPPTYIDEDGNEIPPTQEQIDAYNAAVAAAQAYSAALGVMINNFWVEYTPHLDAFVNAGGTFLRSKFASETKYPFLDAQVAPGITARLYIVDKLTY